MEIIKEIIQNILIIVLLNILLEMLMPRSDLGRYIKLVMGLFIIVAVLNPVLGFLNKDISIMTIKSPTPKGEDLEGLIEKGKAFGEEKRQAAVTDYEKKVAQQVLALVRLDGKAKVQKVVVEAEKDPGDADFGSLKEIVVYLGENQPDSGDGETVRVKPVEINVNGSDPAADKKPVGSENKEITGLRKVLADFYGMDPEKITVIAGQ